MMPHPDEPAAMPDDEYQRLKAMRECGCQPYGKHVNECPQSKYQRNLREMLYDEPRVLDAADDRDECSHGRGFDESCADCAENSKQCRCGHERSEHHKGAYEYCTETVVVRVRRCDCFGFKEASGA